MSKADWKKAARDLAVRSVSDENIEATKATLKQLIAVSINQLLAGQQG